MQVGDGMKEYFVRSNVKVVFDGQDKGYPQARLMYKVKGFIFSKWIEVNSCSQTDMRYRQRSAEEMIDILVRGGHRGKHRKQKERKLKYQLSQM